MISFGKIYCVVLLAVVLAACDDIFEEDISRDSVTVVAPVDGVTSAVQDICFLWRSLAEADGYHLTVVSPSFVAAARVVADTVLYNDSVTVRTECRLKLDNGDYQWSIRAFNSAYTTGEQVYTFHVNKPEEPVEPDGPTDPDEENGDTELGAN